MNHAKGDCVVFMASDLQDPPELIAGMVAQWQQGYQVVWAVREKIEGISLARKLLSGLFYKLMNSYGEITLPPTGADFALLDKKVVQALLKSAGTTPSLGGLIASLGFRTYELKYIKQARKFGKSKWTLAKRIKSFIDAFVLFSFAPMRFMSYLGLFLSAFGFIYALFIIANRVISRPTPGYASIMVAILIIGGFQMIMLGVLGEYLWRNLEEARKKPLFFIEKDSSEANDTQNPYHEA